MTKPPSLFHRLTASQIADRIIVFSNGVIVESGTHKELIVKTVFAHTFEKQSGPYIKVINHKRSAISQEILYMVIIFLH